MNQKLRRKKIKLDFGVISKEYKDWRKKQEAFEAERMDKENYEMDLVKGFHIGSSLFWRDRYCDHINQMNAIFKEDALCEFMEKEKRSAI